MNPQAHNLGDIQGRLLKLEKQNCQFKQLGIAVLILPALLLVMGQAASKKTVEANEFVLRDANENVRARLFMDVGQRSRLSNLSKYNVPANPTVLGLMLLQADMVALRENAGYGKNGIAPARFFFDPKSEKITAFITVDGSFLSKAPSASVRETLSTTAEGTFTDLRISIPELSENNFEVDFRNLTGNGPVDFGEFKNGMLVLH